MDDLGAILSQIMSNPDSMQQIQSMAASLGLGGGNNGATSPQLPSPPQQTQQTTGGGLDLSALAALLGDLQQQSAPAPTPPPAPAQNAMPDLSMLANLLSGSQPQQAPAQNNNADFSALSGLLGNLTGGNQQKPSGGPDLSALTALLNGGNTPAASPAGLLSNINLSTIMKLSQALSSVQNNRSNIDLLLALKPRLNDDRAKKVDDAIRVMQLIQFLPLIKESGLFGDMDNILGGLGGLVGNSGNGGGLGGLLGNVGNGIGGLLGGLGRR